MSRFVYANPFNVNSTMSRDEYLLNVLFERSVTSSPWSLDSVSRKGS